MTVNIPYSNIISCNDLGRSVRQVRKQQQLTQAELAAISGVGLRFVSELENGKPTLEFGRVLRVVASLGLHISLAPRGWEL